LFWGINLKLVDIGEVKKIGENQLNAEENNPSSENKQGFLNNLGRVINKILDCCRE
jgi:hypothetical protein